MAKKGHSKEDRRAAKQCKLQLDLAAAARLNKLDDADSNTPIHSLKIRNERRDLPNDFSGSDPQNPKTISVSSGTTPPIPPPVLLDLIHNFLKDFEYATAAHGIRTDNQERTGHNMSLWNRTSHGYPTLLDIFLQWREQNPNVQSTILPGEDQAPPRTAGMAMDVNDADPKPLSRHAHFERSQMMSSDPSDSSDSSGDESGIDVGISKEVLSATKSTASDSEVSSVSDESSSSDDSSVSSSSSSSLSSSASKSKVSRRTMVKSSSKQLVRSESLVGSVSDPGSGSEVSEYSSNKYSKDSDAECVTALKAISTKPEADALPNGEALNSSDSSVTLTEFVEANSKRDELQFSSSSALSSSSSSSSSSETEIVKPAKQTGKVLQREHTSSNKRKRHSIPSSTVPTIIPDTVENVKRLKKENIPFSRIPGNVKVDPKFSSNKYIPYDYAEKAHQDLAVTKGKGFTKEKNKKKRGQRFSGGMIDIAGSRAVKFDD